MKRKFVAALFPNFPQIRDYLVPLIGKKYSAYNSIIQLLYHIQEFRQTLFAEGNLFNFFQDRMRHYYSSISTEKFVELLPKTFTSQERTLFEILERFLIETSYQDLFDMTVLATADGDNYEDDHPVWKKLDLQLISNSDKLKTENPKVFVHFEDALQRCIGSKEDKTIENVDGYISSTFYWVITKLPKYVLCQIKRRYRQFDEFDSQAYYALPFPIANMIDFDKYYKFGWLNEVVATRYKLMAIIFTDFRTMFTTHYAILIRIEGVWVLFSDDKISFPEYDRAVNLAQLNMKISKTASLLLYKRVKEYMDDTPFRLEAKEVDLNIDDSSVLEESDIESGNNLFRQAATSTSEYSTVSSPISDHSYSTSPRGDHSYSTSPINDHSTSSSPIIEHQQEEPEIRHIRTHHQSNLVHPFHLRDRFANLRGILSVDPEWVPDQVLDNSAPEDNFRAIFFRCCSKQLAQKSFLRNDIGADNLALLNERLKITDHPNHNQHVVRLAEFIHELFLQHFSFDDDNNDTKYIAEAFNNLLRMMPNDQENDEFDDDFFTMENYVWENRAELLDAATALKSIKTHASNKRRKTLAEKQASDNNIQDQYDAIHETFVKKIETAIAENRLKKPSKFCKEFHAQRASTVCEEEVVPAYSTLKHWFHDYLSKRNENEEFSIKRDTRGGTRISTVKLTDRVLECLVCTLLDFPQWTTQQRTAYINGPHGATNQGIKLTTIMKACQRLEFTVKRTRYSPPARNSVGLKALRIVWAKMMLGLLQTQACFLFVDEAGIVVNPSQYMCRGIIGVTPLTVRNLRQQRTSVVAAVIPGFGVIYKWSKGLSIDNTQYKEFLLEVFDVVRRYIGTGDTKIVLIHDNASIHWTTEVINAINANNVILMPTIPYSPQLNYLAECYFGITKGEIAKMSVPNYILLESKKDSERFLKEIHKKWDDATIKIFDAKTTADMFDEWVCILKDCVDGKPLGHDGHHEHEKTNHLEELRSLVTYRLHPDDRIEGQSNFEDVTILSEEE